MTELTKTSTKPLMPAIYEDEVWTVQSNKQEFKLTGSQVGILKEATEGGHRGLVWFDGFAISIPHITYVKRTTKSSSTVDKKVVELKKKFNIK